MDRHLFVEHQVIQPHLGKEVRQIGFKLAAGTTTEVLLAAAESLREAYNLSAVVANRLEDLEDGVRAHWVNAEKTEVIPTLNDLTEKVCAFIEEV